MPPVSQQGVLGDAGAWKPACCSRHLSIGEQWGVGRGCTDYWVTPAMGCPQLAGWLGGELGCGQCRLLESCPEGLPAKITQHF